MALLSESDIAEGLATVPEWTRAGASISRTVQAPTFLAGIDLVRAVAAAAEAADHHPDIDIRWRKVTFTLSTHSAGGLTARDFALAREIDQLAARPD
ncbi:4a-hydroxytetrahydrobiopterin dehydratase [Nocardia puris]|uniref:Putative pterin-4-alpha-carbinolamine dehydratase n=1 Tax=Nocardia puris TaxID=208602 RepID=A0A366DRG7_9NOCA|nr:4a-hydroxytetrahydrobiopterin dehydratase [Nocardia puris]MBF6210829.1 4a-hydroxytetrahydrobiopterin dehydratase [Nocardia puris]MBF6364424.1 4a-hydroxytetrahydrobiopterin dehydratase [Nocardia puris]MBF6459353.1 4a-hydroxytetrahydrobiopterin dehydratase [Nocardia puris]RBO92687.1 4a-hydroxytetrahydrobiopterin dehydratase [Nocardia puris]